jgi:hypothetical protein
LNTPLVSRPPYGEGRARTPRAEAKLPGGSPAGRGLPLDPNIPGESTFTKPEDDNSTSDSPSKGESIYRVESPRDLAKEDGEVPEIDNGGATPGYMGLGKPDNSPKTKYPYRDGIPNAHNASAEFVTGMWLLRKARDFFLPGGCRRAALMDTMTQGLNPGTVQKGQSCAVTLKRADATNLRWLFAVDCGNGAKVVRLKAARIRNSTQFRKLDLHLACSCPAWRWQGPEYHSTTRGYQDPATPLQGTASAPNIRDPQRVNKVCKHVAAVLSFTERWTVPQRK